MPRRSPSQVAARRAAILETAAAEASVRGFEAASLGRLASSLGMSKSGLVRHFGDKEQLQIAAFEAGVEGFVAEVWRPAEGRPAGRERLLALCDAWTGYLARRVLPGGCLMTAAAVEFGAQPGPVRDAVATARRRWLRLLEREVATAVAQGELAPSTDPADLAFSLDALAAAASTALHLSGDDRAPDRARRLMHRLLAG